MFINGNYHEYMYARGMWYRDDVINIIRLLERQ